MTGTHTLTGDLARELMKVATNPSLYFQQSLDSSQARGPYEKQLLQTSGLNARRGGGPGQRGDDLV